MMSVEAQTPETPVAEDYAALSEFLTLRVGEQLFGIPVLQVQDVLRYQRVTRVPLAPPEISGSMNLRGRIVTVIDMRLRLNIVRPQGSSSSVSASGSGSGAMSVVVEYQNDLYSLVIDRVGDVLPLKNSCFEAMPTTVNPAWAALSSGIYRLDDELLIVLDVSKLLSSAQ
ncbi:MAG: chemotaxis protein CheW [Alphaproteobacteria bacterium]